MQRLSGRGAPAYAGATSSLHATLLGERELTDGPHPNPLPEGEGIWGQDQALEGGFEAIQERLELVVAGD